jgi:hypothetical protein
VKARYAAGRFVAVDAGAARFALPTEPHRQQCERLRAEVEAAIAARFGVAVPLRLVVEREGERSGEPPVSEPDDIDLDGLQDAPEVTSPEDRLRQAFPGAQEVEP